jgi:DNA-binding IclR family transcriptional regulator
MEVYISHMNYTGSDSDVNTGLPTGPAGKKNRVPAVERAIDILEFLIGRNEAVSIKELAESLKIPKVSVFRIMKSLESKGYVHNQGKTGLYVLGTKIVSIGTALSRDANLSQIANPYMFDLARRTGQTVQLGILFEYQIMYIDQIRTTDALTLIVPNRKPFAVNTSAGGKVLVSNLEPERMQEFLDKTVLEANTPNAIVDKQRFFEELVKVKKQGYAIDDEEFARGIRCIAAPVHNNAGETIASLGITGHTREITDDRIATMVNDTLEIAREISTNLGHHA